MADDNQIELAALIFAIAALMIASGQLLQQVFATADGYRRCEISVIGPWADKTRLVWRWRQFRFETKFTTPDIVLYNINDLRAAEIRTGKSSMIEDITQSPLVRMLCLNSDPTQDESADLASWTSLLRQLLRLQTGLLNLNQMELSSSTTFSTRLVDHATRVGIISRERTWDLMPPGVTRPLARSNLGTMITIAHRLRMQWTTYQVADGVFHAQGAGDTFTSSREQGLGIVFRYDSATAPASNLRAKLDVTSDVLRMRSLVPNEAADKMACGILHGIPDLMIPGIPLIGRNESESNDLLSMGLTMLGLAANIVKELVEPERQSAFRKGFFIPMFFPMNDMIALVCPFLPVLSNPATKWK